MSGTEVLPPSLSNLQRIFQSVSYIREPGEAKQTEECLLSKLSPETRRYLQHTSGTKWPPTPDRSLVPDAAHLRHLKTYLAWALEQRDFQKAVRTMLLFECSGTDTPEAPLFSDVMDIIEDEAGSDDVIPPQLLVSWAKHLQVKGDLHGAIRRLNAARDLILEHKGSFPCSCEADRIHGDCSQMAGLTLNKMCCWKSAVPSLMESVEIFRACASIDRNLEAMVVSLEMIAKCLCNIPHGDYLELKEQLSFQHDDRFFQAYTMCKDAVTLASSSELLRIRALNQAAESLLKFSAQQEDTTKLQEYLGQVITEARTSLQAHTSLWQLARREQFFEFVHSLFLVSTALDFSDSPEDQRHAAALGEISRFLYGEYCRQLCEDEAGGGDKGGFQLSRIDLKTCPELGDVLRCLVDELDLKLDLGEDRALPVGKQSLATRDKLRVAKTDQDGIGRPAESPIDPRQANTGHTVSKASKTGRQLQNSNILAEAPDNFSEIQSSRNTEGTPIHRNTNDESAEKDNVSQAAETPIQGNQNKLLEHAFQDCSLEGRQLFSTAEQKRSPIKLTRPHPRLQEVGLPVNPEDYSIPLYDVPRSIFRDLIGCKFTPRIHTDNVSGLTTLNDAIEDSHHLTKRQDPPGEDPLVKTDESSGMRGITVDDVLGSNSLALVNTFMTTKLPELPEGSSCGNSEADSGIGNSLSGCCSSSASSFGDSRLSNDKGSFTRPPQLSQSSDVTNTVSKARLLKFNPVTGIWSSQLTLVYVGQPLPLDDKVKGNCRDALHVQFLHQDEVLGRYVGKRYRRQRPPSQYLQDVTCQKTARFLVTLFNYALQNLRYDIQVVYVPVAHLQLLSRDGNEEVVDWLNVEPYLEGDFIKLTNNLKFCNSQGRTLATALTHFTHSVSDGKLMLVDLQGWLPREGRGVVYMTDPQFHTVTPTSLSACDMGQRGMHAFWETVHPQCNAICHALGLKRPDEASSAMPRSYD